MLQDVDGKRVYIVEFDTMPETPITGMTQEEAVYQYLVNFATFYAGGSVEWRAAGMYAQALTHALDNGVITEPGKYAIEITDPRDISYMIYRVEE